MLDEVIAEKAGITLADLDDLVKGRIYEGVQTRLGVPMGYVGDYINQGSCAALLAERLDFNMVAAERLGKVLGREGRVGLIIGILISR